MSPSLKLNIESIKLWILCLLILQTHKTLFF
jgi:hypothetical protein